MRRAKFVELVSAYLDGEITSGEREILMDEIRRDPGRRSMFSRYMLLNSAAGRARFAACSCSGKAFVPSRSTLMWCLGGSLAGVAVAFLFMGTFFLRTGFIPSLAQNKEGADVVAQVAQTRPSYAQTLAPHLFAELVSFRRDTVHPFFASLKTQSASAFQSRRDTFILLEDEALQGLMDSGDKSSVSPFFQGQQTLGMTFTDVSFGAPNR